jgi:hypothetical protein
MKEKNLYESIIAISVKLQETNLKKSGKNRFAGFEYFELADFLPTLNKLMLEEGVCGAYYIDDEFATLDLIKGDEKQSYTIPFERFETPLNKNGQPSMQDIQYLGALNTYYKRYLYLNAFGITDGDVIDSMDSANLKKGKKLTEEEEQETLDLLIELDELLLETDTDREKFYAYYNVKNNREMNLEQLRHATALLRKKLEG